jgi:hypothetical protein
MARENPERVDTGVRRYDDSVVMTHGVNSVAELHR